LSAFDAIRRRGRSRGISRRVPATGGAEVAGPRNDERERERVLHERLLDGDPLATADLFQHFAASLLSRLAAKYPTTDLDLVEQAVSDALLDYFQRPERYDSGKRSLRGYLFTAAERDLLNLREYHQRRHGRVRPADPVELDAHARKQWEEGDDVGDRIAADEAAATLWDDEMAAARTDEERIVQRLRLEGERSNAVYAAALGWEDLPPAEQRRRLYLIKDRLDQRWRRRGERHG
jgi:RNA polymerase sigma-70 factor, ECF subfamily